MDVTKKYRICFAVFHVILFVAFLVFMKAQAGKAQHQLYWMVWLVIDFPVSVLMLISFMLRAVSYELLIFIHGVLGTIWWYFLPDVFISIDQRVKKKPTK